MHLVLQVKNLKKFDKRKGLNAFSAGNSRKFFGIDYANSKRKIPFKIFQHDPLWKIRNKPSIYKVRKIKKP